MADAWGEFEAAAKAAGGKRIAGLFEAEPDRLKTLKVFVRQPADQVGSATQTFKFRVEDKASFETDEYTATFNAPEAAR